MISLNDLPTVNCVLNSISAVLLVTGFVLIRRGRKVGHKRCMLAAFGTSTLFLASYLTYHFSVDPKKYDGTGVLRAVYFFILITHVVLAMVLVPMALRTLFLACKERWTSHRRWARWTFPIWVYVSVTGVLVYFLLY